MRARVRDRRRPTTRVGGAANLPARLRAFVLSATAATAAAVASAAGTAGAADADVDCPPTAAPTYSVVAPSGPQPFTRRFYAGLGIGGSRLEPESPISDLRVGDEHDTGYHLSLGYDVARWLSAELYLADLGAAGIDRDSLPTVTGPAIFERDYDAIDYRIADVAALLYLLNTRSGLATRASDGGLQRREGVSLYARIGLGAMRNDAERDRVLHEREHDGHVSVGLGLEGGFANGFALRAEYIAFDTDAHYASIGVIKRFGRVPPAPGPAYVRGDDRDVKVECPERKPEPPIGSAQPLKADFRFGFDQALLTPESRAALDAFVEAVRDDDRVLVVHGHTDSVGPADYNERLGRRRAEAIADYLVESDIARERLEIESFGEDKPKESNETPAGRAANRRVELSTKP